mgnify:CR=1 FL=1
MNDKEELATPMEMDMDESSDDKEPAFSLSCKVASKTPENYDDDERLNNRKADEQFQLWFDEDQVSNKHLFDNAVKLSEEVGAELTIEQVVSSFNILKYF